MRADLTYAWLRWPQGSKFTAEDQHSSGHPGLVHFLLAMFPFHCNACGRDVEGCKTLFVWSMPLTKGFSLHCGGDPPWAG